MVNVVGAVGSSSTSIFAHSDLGRADQIGEPVECLERVDRRLVSRAEHDGAHDGMDGIGDFDATRSPTAARRSATHGPA